MSCVGRSHPAWAPSSDTPAGKAPIQDQLKESLQYRRSLFMSVQLRLHSLQKRVDNAITFAFNVVTQLDSRLMRRDSASMTIISFITMIFLPTAGVATIIGSQLFVTEFDKSDGRTSVTYTSPLFATLWWIAIPLTLVTTLVALLYRWMISADKQTRHSAGSGWIMSWWSKANIRERPRRVLATTASPVDTEMYALPASPSSGVLYSVETPVRA